MTNTEALIWCDDFRDNIVMCGKGEEKYILALDAMRTVMAALEKQIPKKPKGMICPNCGADKREGKENEETDD